MFEITIKGDTLSALASNALAIAAQFQTTAPRNPATDVGGEEHRETKPRKAKAEPVSTTAEDEKLAAELAAPVGPMPDTAKAIVDAGTGQPIAPVEVKQMTIDDVRAAAAKLAAKDTPKLSELLNKYGAAKLSEVPNAKLGDFAGDVMEALG